MGFTLAVDQTINVGKETVIESASPTSDFAVVFEDDCDTGYFYGINKKKANPILDALHIYDVKSVTDKDIPSQLVIIWSSDGLKAALLLNQYPHAVFDFQAKRGYCRSNFPPPDKSWTKYSHEWDDRTRELFK